MIIQWRGGRNGRVFDGIPFKSHRILCVFARDGSDAKGAVVAVHRLGIQVPVEKVAPVHQYFACCVVDRYAFTLVCPGKRRFGQRIQHANVVVGR